MSSVWSKEVFSRNLRMYIDKSGKSQREIAEVIGVSAPTLNEWINQKKYPRIDKIQRLADYFGILKSDLIEDKGEEQKEKPDEYAGLTDEQRALIEFAKTLSEDQAGMILRVVKSILGVDE